MKVLSNHPRKTGVAYAIKNILKDTLTVFEAKPVIMKNEFFFLILFFIILIGSNETFGQTPQFNFPDAQIVIPPSPNAAGLGKFIDNKVGYHTGTAAMSVPIYDLQLGKLILPISLSYSGTAVKVDQIASWVGIGWTLNAGGVLSRTVRGRPDEEGFFSDQTVSATDNFFNGNTPLIQNVTCQQTSERAIREQLVEGCIDTQADLYFFSAPNVSGKFEYRRDKSIMLTPYEPISIVGGPNNINSLDRWIVTGVDGTRYIFGKSHDPKPTNENYRDYTTFAKSPYRQLCGQPITGFSSWHLAEIISSNQADTIFLEYKNGEEIRYSELNSPIYNIQTGTFPGFNVPTWNSETVIQQDQLSKIYTNRGDEIKFITDNTSRLDLQGGHRLSRIEVYKNSLLIKTAVLTPGYFSAYPFDTGSSYVNNYLYLKQLKVSDNTGEVFYPPYKFEYYYEPSDHPNRNSSRHDLFGFFNGNKNQISSNSPPDEKKCQTMLLKEVTFPTGGRRTFTYELHDYANLTSIEYERIDIPEIALIAGPGETKPFILTSTAEGSYTYKKPNDCTITITNGSGTVVWTANGPNTSTITLPAGSYLIRFARSFRGNDPLILSLQLNLSYKGAQISDKKGGGVRIKNIDFYDDFSATPALSYSYSYKELATGKSSGRLKGVIKNTYDIWYDDAHLSEGGGSCQLTYESKMRVTDTKAYRKISQDANVTYGEVAEFIGKSRNASNVETVGVGGKTVYKFTNIGISDNTTFTVLPVIPTTFREYKLGLQTSVEYYEYLPATNNFSMVKKIDNDFAFSNESSTRNLMATRLYNTACVMYVCSSQTGTPLYVGNVYEEYAGRASIVAKREYERDLTQLTNESFYEYENASHLQVTKETRVDSKNDTYITNYFYPLDRPSSETGIPFMNSNNIRNELVERIIKKSVPSGQTTSFTEIEKTRVLFGFDNNLLIERSLDIAKEGGVYLTYNTNLHHDLFGNVTDSQGLDGIQTSFVWSKDGRNLIARVTGALRTQVYYNGFEDEGSADLSARTGERSWNGDFNFIPPQAFAPLPGSILSYWYFENDKWNLNEQPYTGAILLTQGTKIDDVKIFPPKAQMTTYTYDSRSRQSSITDMNNVSSYFFYDSFNRLAIVRDNLRNITKRIDYNLKK